MDSASGHVYWPQSGGGVSQWVVLRTIFEFYVSDKGSEGGGGPLWRQEALSVMCRLILEEIL